VATYAIADIYALQAAIPPRFRLNSGEPRSRRERRDHQQDPPVRHRRWRVVLDQPRRRPARAVLGLPLYESTTMVGTSTTGSKIAVAGDFDQYAIVDRVGMTVAYEPMVKDARPRPPDRSGRLVRLLARRC
jgi:hypothetical protein